MEKKYYTAVEFPELEEPEEESPAIEENDTLHGDLDRAFTEVRRMFASIRTGQSDLRSGSLDLKGTDPSMLAFSVLEKAPSKQNLVSFILLSKQDMGRRAAKEILRVFLDVDKSLEERLNVRL